jgi:hypothetical protein
MQGSSPYQPELHSPAAAALQKPRRAPLATESCDSSLDILFVRDAAWQSSRGVHPVHEEVLKKG